MTVVAHVVDDRGGMEHVHAELIRRLSDRYRFRVVATAFDPSLRAHAQWLPVRVPARPASLRFPAFMAAGSLRVALAGSDLVHTCGAIVTNRADVATVHFCHAGFVDRNGSLAPAGAAPLRRWNTTLLRWQALRAERRSYRPGRTTVLAAVSGQTEAELRRHYSDAQIRLTPLGVDDRFRPATSGDRTLRHRLGGDDDDVVAIFVGGDWARKGLEVALEAVGVARRAGHSITLWVLGSGDIPRYEKRAAEAGVAGAVRFFGQVSDPAPYYQAADVYICCSSYETFNLALLEAAACGLPVISTPVGIAPEFVPGSSGSPGGKAGVIVAADPRAVGAALGRMAADAVWRRTMSAAAAGRAAEYGWDRAAGRVDRVYQDLLAAP